MYICWPTAEGCHSTPGGAMSEPRRMLGGPAPTNSEEIGTANGLRASPGRRTVYEVTNPARVGLASAPGRRPGGATETSGAQLAVFRAPPSSGVNTD